MADSPSIVVSTGPARGLVGGVARHMLILEEIAQHLPVRWIISRSGDAPKKRAHGRNCAALWPITSNLHVA